MYTSRVLKALLTRTHMHESFTGWESVYLKDILKNMSDLVKSLSVCPVKKDLEVVTNYTYTTAYLSTRNSYSDISDFLLSLSC